MDLRDTDIQSIASSKKLSFCFDLISSPKNHIVTVFCDSSEQSYYSKLWREKFYLHGNFSCG